MTNSVIAVIGSGYVGTSTAAILSNAGYKVNIVDIDQSKVDKVNSGKAPFYEFGLDNLISRGLKEGSLKASVSYKETIQEADIVISCVGTPDNPDGSSNLSYVFSAAEEASRHMKDGAVFVQKSTVPVGTGKKVKSLIRKHKSKFTYVSNPEFLREGTAVQDTLLFDRVVAGGNKVSCEKVLDLYKKIEENSYPISRIAGLKGTKNDHDLHTGSYIATSLESAELIKVTANAFLALKISFANAIAKLADASGADIIEVMDGIGSDRRIGRAFLNAGRGYGGGCFPKDVSGLIDSAREHGVDMSIMESATHVNSSMPGYIANKLKDAFKDKSLAGKKIAVLGLAFKPGTSDARKSPAVLLANTLVKKGASVTAYDPEAIDEAKEDLLKAVSLCSTSSSAIKDVDAVIVATDWDEFKNLEFLAKATSKMSGNIFVDAMNAFEPNVIKSVNLSYIGVGR